MILQCIVPSSTLLKIPASHAKTSPLHCRSISTNLATTCRPRGVSQISTVVCQTMPTDGDDVKGGVFEGELKVRDYELDQFGVVHHAVYVNFRQQERHELLEKIGINIDAMGLAGYARALIIEAKCMVVWLNKNYRPVRIPPEVSAELVQHPCWEGADD